MRLGSVLLLTSCFLREPVFANTMQEEPLLRGARAVAYRPLDGSIAVLDAEGARLIRFDLYLRRGDDIPLQRGGFVDVLSYGGDWWLLDSAGGTHRLRPDAEPSLQSVSAPELAARFVEQVPAENAASAQWQRPLGRIRKTELQIVGNRRLILDPELGTLRLTSAWWERRPEIEWGPGWATLRFGSGMPMAAAIEWRAVGAGSRLSPLVSDRRFPARKRAYLEPVVAGEELEIRSIPRGRRYPATTSPTWIRVTVPQVSITGSRPVTVLASEI